MQSILLAIAMLACPVGMGLMMWVMGRGQRQDRQDGSREQELAQLRAEIDQLKDERAGQGVAERR